MVSNACLRAVVCHALNCVVAVPQFEIASNGRSHAQRLRILRSFARLTDAIVLLLTGAATADVRRRLTASSQPLRRRRRPEAFQPLTRFHVWALRCSVCVRPRAARRRRRAARPVARSARYRCRVLPSISDNAPSAAGMMRVGVW